MKWYAAHVIVAPIVDGNTGPIEAFENVYLVKGETIESALRCAEELGRAEEVDDGLTIDGKPGKWVFLGVRKLISISNLVGDQDEDPPSDGSEITYSRVRFETLSEAEGFARGNPAALTALE